MSFNIKITEGRPYRKEIFIMQHSNTDILFVLINFSLILF